MFHRWFVGRMLPDLKPATRAAFRTVNRGGRYERGSAQVVEEHFTAEKGDRSNLCDDHASMVPASGPFRQIGSVPFFSGPPRVLVVKINSHVAVRDTPAGPVYGRLMRYGRESTCCGALATLIQGSQLPALRELAKVFALDGRDRLGAFRDADRVPLDERALRAAVVNARLQARRAAADIAEHRPHGPAVFLVVPCVTINRTSPDTELVVGQYSIDWTGKAARITYVGLGDDPAAYRVRHERRSVIVEDT